jgi:hypothetical protein
MVKGKYEIVKAYFGLGKGKYGNWAAKMIGGVVFFEVLGVN